MRTRGTRRTLDTPPRCAGKVASRPAGYARCGESRENRLIRIEPVSTPFVNDDRKLEFKYDYMGRRVEKVYWKHDGTDWVVQTRRRFVYDGWNPVLWLSVNAQDEITISRKFTWGLDLSGLSGDGSVSGIHGAGGIGGLLAHQSGTGTSNFWYLYDGNGNVGQVIDRSSLPTIQWGTSAHFEYDPYGNIVHYRGLMGGPAYRTFCFSTKWLDTELSGDALGSTVTGAVGPTGLYYYGYRYYSPRLGRWISRDPLGNRNRPGPAFPLYPFVSNGPVMKADPDGRWEIPPGVGPITGGIWLFCATATPCFVMTTVCYRNVQDAYEDCEHDCEIAYPPTPGEPWKDRQLIACVACCGRKLDLNKKNCRDSCGTSGPGTTWDKCQNQGPPETAPSPKRWN